jgi:hypothetical protein
MGWWVRVGGSREFSTDVERRAEDSPNFCKGPSKKLERIIVVTATAVHYKPSAIHNTA